MGYSVGEIGKNIIVNTNIDTTASNVRHIRYWKPDGTNGYWVSSVYGTTSLVYKTTSATDLDISGIWKIQSYIEDADGKFKGEIAHILVNQDIPQS